MFTRRGGCFDISNPIGTADQEWIFACNCEGLNDHSTRTMDYSSLKTGLQPINDIKTGRSTCRLFYIIPDSQQKHPNDHRKHQRDLRGGIEKKPSGTMLMSMSVRGSRDPQIIVEKILWKTMKYFEKSVDIMPIRASATAKDRAGADTEGFRDQAL